jgi:glycosyltransferase involved in cell wall biosynthesis
LTDPKIAIVSFQLEGGGGAAAVAHELARSLVELGKRVLFITTDRQRGQRRERIDGLDVIRIRPSNLFWIGDLNDQPTWKRALFQGVDTWNPHSYRLLLRTFRAEAPDLVHFHKLRGISPSAWSAARSAGVTRIIQTAHDYELISPQGTLTGRVGRAAERKAWWLGPYRSARRRAARSVDVITAPSEHTLARIVSSGFFGAAEKRRIPNSHAFTRTELERLRAALQSDGTADRRTVRLLYLGRLETEKGIGLLCEVFAAIAGERPELRLEVAGYGSEAAALRSKFAQVSAITFHGAVAGEAKLNLLRDCDALVVPSLWPEVFGIVILEAYAYGLPVIAFDAGGIPELVGDGETGYLLPQGDRSALRRCLLTLADHPERLRGLSPACFARAARYSRERFTSDYMSLYQDLTN